LESNLDIEFNADVNDAEQYQIRAFIVYHIHRKCVQCMPETSSMSLFLVAINISVSEDGILNLTVKNNYNANALNSFTNEKGIGLENAKKRLSVIYPDEKHFLNIHQDEKFYYVALTIHLN